MDTSCEQGRNNRGSQRNSIFHTMTRERWYGLIECKKNFMKEEYEDPSDCPFLDPAVAASWVLSRNAGLDPSQPSQRTYIPNEEIQKIRAENQFLIELAKPIFKTFSHLPDKAFYSLSIDNIEGVPLLVVGEVLSTELKDLIYEKVDESFHGTNAHTLALRHRCPVQLQGPENFLVERERHINFVAPIFGDDSTIIAFVSLCQILPDPPWDPHFQAVCAQTLGLISAMATAIENKIVLKRSQEDLAKSNQELFTVHKSLATAYHLVDVTLDMVDEGIVTIDPAGTITNINEKGRHILNIVSLEQDSCHITDYLKNKDVFMKLLEQKVPADIEDMISSEKGQQPYVISILPVLEQTGSRFEGAVLKLNHVDKINARALSRVGSKASFSFSNIIGDSDSFRNTIQLAECFAESPENILLTGESGTGKELFAQAIHNAYRPYGPFVALNCAAFPRNLIESELFGYERGSFTGADRNGRPGKIELANRGTLFLDEIGDMPVEVQAILLRVLQDKQVTRIGGYQAKQIDFRIIAATNQDLKALIHKKMFREDLYFRLSVLNLKLPPLRKRGNDIELLTKYFVDNYCRKMNWATPEISPEVQQLLNDYSWPGNVRELENTIIRCVNMSRGGTIYPEHLPEELLESASSPYTQSPTVGQGEPDNHPIHLKTLQELERIAVQNALAQTNNNVTQAAHILGISKTTLYRKIKEHEAIQ